MSWSRPNPTYTRLELPGYTVGSITNTVPAVLSEAHGRSRDGGRVMFEVDAATTVTLYVWSPLTKKWRFPSASSANYQKTFADPGMDYFDVPEGSLFYLSSSSTVNCYADCDRPQPVPLR